MAITSVPLDTLETYVAAILDGRPIPTKTGDLALDRALAALTASDRREHGEDVYSLRYWE